MRINISVTALYDASLNLFLLSLSVGTPSETLATSYIIIR